jgi:hypothetical protein
MRKPPLRSNQQRAAGYVSVHGYPGTEAMVDGEESFA